MPTLLATARQLVYGPAAQAPRRALFLLLIAVISWLALTPHPPRELSTGWDKSNHLLAFGALMLSSRLAWPRRRWTLLLALFAYGGLIEILQTFVPGRDGEWPDLLADSLGLALGLLLDALLRRSPLAPRNSG
ncbi:VanZ family protein [Roseateles violae]|uniref:VanZ family protein n=1 Tax=Roseateles violae TaxID=3058042 RepID=A0ABT8DUP6_9BURK|nr:VanZ family protein [Pelomonas sp. PFR6]MDN3920773.1 VanZ family protein [Pelomonas sp. PFR6]